MALDKAELKTALKATFDNAKTQNWTVDQLSAALADAIDRFVRTADVVDITVDVRNAANQLIGTGKQSGHGRLI